MSVKGNIGTLRELNKRLRVMPTVVAQRVAKRSAGALTYLAGVAYDSGVNVYGDARPASSAKPAYHYGKAQRAKWKKNAEKRKAAGVVRLPRVGGAKRRGGGALSLVQTGATRARVVFVANGTIVRCVLGTKYARYLIGKYGILPNGNAAIPVEWQDTLQLNVNAAIRDFMSEGV